MAEITINGVKYTNVPNKKAGTKFAASLTQSNIGASQAVQDYVNSAYFYPLVNAIDINWNGVEVDENSYINTTSDLITYIATKGSSVDLSSYATVDYVNQQIEDVIGGAPETLDTLKELADALADEASLAYVTQALDGKADKSSLNDYATNSYVTIELDKKANKTDIPVVPDMSNYVTMTAYNMLVQRVDELAYLISYYHPTPEPTPTPTFEFTYGTGSIWTVYNSGMDSVAIWLNNTTGYTANYSSDNANVMVDPSTGVLSWTIGSQNATITATANAGMYTTSMYVYTDSGGKLTPSAQWTANGMNYGSSIIVNQNQGLTTLTFSGTPLSGWTFTDPAVTGITVDTSTGSITVDPANAEPRIYNVTATYPEDATYNYYSLTFAIKVESGKQSSIGHWYDSNNVITSNKAVIAGDITTYTFTFQSTPASGWSFSDPMMTGITVDQSNGTITIDPHGMPDSAYPINITASYMEDSSYWASMASFSIKVLPEGANPDFYYESSSINLSNTMPSQSPMLHNSLTYDHIGYSSSDSNVATVNSYGTIEYVGPGTCYVDATAYDSSNNVLATANITVYCTQSKQMPDFQWYDSSNLPASEYVVNLGGSGTEVFSYDATPIDGWTITGDNGTSIVLDTALKTLTIDKSSLSTRGNNLIVAQRAEDSSYYSTATLFNVTVIPAGESTDFFFRTQGVSMSPSFASMSLMLINYTGIDTKQYPINYSSSDTSVATVDNYGTVTYVGAGNAIITATLSNGNTTYTATATVEATVTYSNASVYYNNDPNQGQGFLDTNPYEIGLGSGGIPVDISFEGPEYNTNNASNDFSIVYDTNFSTPKAMDATIINLTNTYSSGVNHIKFDLSPDNVTMSEAGEQNRFILTFGHSGTTYLTDYIKFEFNGAQS